MKKYVVLVAAFVLAITITACGQNTNTAYSEYPYEATIDGNDEIVILGKTEQAISEFLVQLKSAEIDSALSGLDEIYITESDSALKIEKAEFENAESPGGFSSIYITVKNQSGEDGTLVNIIVDFIDENGNIMSTTYPQYTSVLEDGQSCRMQALYEGIPYGVRVASANMTSLSGNERIEVMFDEAFVAINPE